LATPRQIPGEKKLGLLQRKAVVELIASGPPVVAALVGALNAPAFRPWLLGGAVWLGLASLVKVLHANHQDQEARRIGDYDGLIGALEVLHATVAHECSISDAEAHAKLRVTVHRVVPGEKNKDPEWIEQIAPYVGDGQDGSGRRFSIRSGVTGLAIRGCQPYAGARENDDEVAYIRELQAQWSYSETEAKNLSRGRYSFMAVPIRSGQSVVGVVYLDSSERDLFSSTDVVDVIVAACGGINRYVERRY
jgi:hypothetical protein